MYYRYFSFKVLRYIHIDTHIDTYEIIFTDLL